MELLREAWLLDMLVNSLINQPGPLNLDGEEFKLAIIGAFHILTSMP